MEGKVLIGRKPGQRDFSARVGKEVGKGGSATIYARADRDSEVLKVYHPPQAPEYEAKIAAMLKKGPPRGLSSDTIIAWPLYQLRDSSDRFLGFGMPKVDFRESHDLLAWKDRARRNHNKVSHDVRHRLLLVRNLAQVLGTLHASQTYIVDLKPQNLRGTIDDSKVCLIDCDGYVFSGFEALQFTPGYAAPGLATKLKKKGRLAASALAEQDRFALAVIAYELLLGRHPCMDVLNSAVKKIPPTIDKRLERWIFGCVLQSEGGAGLPPLSLFPHIPSDLQSLFIQAFKKGVRSRPMPEDWMRVLDKRLKPILHDPNPLCHVGLDHLKLAGVCAHCSSAASSGSAPRVPYQPAAPAVSGKRARMVGLSALALGLLFLWFLVFWPPRSPAPPQATETVAQERGPQATASKDAQYSLTHGSEKVGMEPQDAVTRYFDAINQRRRVEAWMYFEIPGWDYSKWERDLWSSSGCARVISSRLVSSSGGSGEVHADLCVEDTRDKRVNHWKGPVHVSRQSGGRWAISSWEILPLDESCTSSCELPQAREASVEPTAIDELPRLTAADCEREAANAVEVAMNSYPAALSRGRTADEVLRATRHRMVDEVLRAKGCSDFDSTSLMALDVVVPEQQAPVRQAAGPTAGHAIVEVARSATQKMIRVAVTINRSDDVRRVIVRWNPTGSAWRREVLSRGSSVGGDAVRFSAQLKLPMRNGVTVHGHCVVQVNLKHERGAPTRLPKIEIRHTGDSDWFTPYKKRYTLPR